MDPRELLHSCHQYPLLQGSREKAWFLVRERKGNTVELDPVSVDRLKKRLAAQAIALAAARSRLLDAVFASIAPIAVSDWSGIVRAAYDKEMRELRDTLERADRRLGDAAAQSRTAISTLEHRVG